MSDPSTKILDHLLYLTPPGTLEQTSQQFRELGFNVIAGGSHAGGLTANTLIILGDGTYLEVIAFAHPASHYPLGSPERQKRDSSPWATKAPGWADFCFAGSSATSIAHIINARAEQDGSGIKYALESPFGRTCEDGRVLEWVITLTEDVRDRGTVPFYCGDVTPRDWRVPVEPPSNLVHPSGAQSVAYLRLLAKPEDLVSVSAQLTTVFGEPPQTGTKESEYTWTLGIPSGKSDTQKPQFILSAPINEEEQNHLNTSGRGIFEVGLFVGPDGVEKEASTPYGKIVWLRSF